MYPPNSSALRAGDVACNVSTSGFLHLSMITRWATATVELF